MEAILGAARHLFGGLVDSFALFNVIPMLNRMPDLVPPLAELLVLNGCLYMGGAYLARHLVLPTLDEWLGPGLLLRTATLTFNFLWLVPGYAACFYVDGRLYDRIAAVIARGENLEGGPDDDKTADSAVEDEDRLYRLLFLATHLGLYTLLPCVAPAWLNWCVGWPSMAALYSLYAYEYHWRRKGWSFRRRVAEVESNVFYHLGFGATSSLVAMLLDTIMGLGWSSILFGLMIFATFPWEWRANQRRLHLEKHRPVRIPIFLPSVLVTNLVILMAITLLKLLYNRPQPPARPPSSTL